MEQMEEGGGGAAVVTTLPLVARSEVEQLHAEIRRYLSAVDAFRSEGCQIRWLAARRGPTPTARPGSPAQELGASRRPGCE